MGQNSLDPSAGWAGSVAHGDLVVVSCISEQTSKCDGIGDAAQVDEEHSRDGLDMETIIYVATVPGGLPLDVQPQTSSNPVKDQRISNWPCLGGCAWDMMENSDTAPPGEFQLLPQFVWSRKFVIFPSGCPTGRAVHLTQFVQVHDRLSAQNLQNQRSSGGYEA